MSNLWWGDGTPFSVGRSHFSDNTPSARERTGKIVVQIRLSSFEGELFARLDTGAAWSILDPEVADELQLFNADGEDGVRLSTRSGTFVGRLVRQDVTLIAHEGESLRVPATVWIARDWPHGNFLGYAGLLERVRFAVDPFESLFYFGTP